MANKNSKPCKKSPRYRSAKTGLFVKKSYADRYPHLTVKEMDCRKKGKAK